ncbi:MAG: PAS domain-containing protein [Vibrio sp.]
MEWNSMLIERAFALEITFLVLVVLSLLYYFHSKAQKRLVTLIQDTPSAIILVDSETGDIIDANKMAIQLLTIRKIGQRFRFPALLSESDFLVALDRHISSYKSANRFVMDWPLTENNKRKIEFIFNSTRVRTKKVWIVHAVPCQQELQDHQKAVLSKFAFNSLTELIFIKDLQGNTLATNHSYDRFWANRETEGCGGRDTAHLEGKRSEQRWTTTPQGENCLLETHFNPLVGDDGDVVGMVGISHDVSNWFYIQHSYADEMDRRKLAEGELAQTETFLQSILQALPDPIAIFNKQRIYQACNQAFADSLGLTHPADIVGHSLDVLLPSELVERFVESDKRVLEQGETLRFIDKVKRKDGRVIHFDVLKAPYCDPITGEFGCLVMARDISQRVLAEQQLTQVNKELERLNYFDLALNISNRRHFDAQFEAFWRLNLRQQLPLTVILCHIDGLDKYRNYYGFDAAQKQLIEIAASLRLIVQRGADLVARFDGDNFVFLLPGICMPNGQVIVDKIHQTLMGLAIEQAPDTNIPDDGLQKYLTASIGVATVLPKRDMDKNTVILAAMDALEMAEKAGGNQTEVIDLLHSN